MANAQNPLSRLSYRQCEIVKLRYGLNDGGYIYTLEQCGKIFKVTRERIRFVQRKAEARLVARYGSDWLTLARAHYGSNERPQLPADDPQGD